MAAAFVSLLDAAFNLSVEERRQDFSRLHFAFGFTLAAFCGAVDLFGEGERESPRRIASGPSFGESRGRRMRCRPRDEVGTACHPAWFARRQHVLAGKIGILTKS